MSEAMKKDVDCQVFGDQLDAMVRGGLPQEGVRQLRRHAEECGDCGMQLRVHEHLLHPSLEELEARVPEALLASVWDGVQTGLARRVQKEWNAERRTGGDGGRAGSPPPPRFAWLMPALAAAALLLLLSSGFLYVELGRVREREASLAQQVVEQQRWLAALDPGAGTDPVARTAALAGRSSWLRALSREESITVEGLRELIGRMPRDRVVLSQARLEAALESRSPLSTPLFREVLVQVRDREEVTARDLLEALDGMAVSPDLSVPTSDLLALLS